MLPVGFGIPSELPRRIARLHAPIWEYPGQYVAPYDRSRGPFRCHRDRGSERARNAEKASVGKTWSACGYKMQKYRLRCESGRAQSVTYTKTLQVEGLPGGVRVLS